MMKQSVLITVIALAAAVPYPAFADIISEGALVVSGSGFGNLPRALTIQSHGPSDPSESGCIAPDGSGGLIAGGSACSLVSGALGGDEQNPLGFPKQSAPTLSSLGITSGTQLGILFDAIQPQNSNNNVVTINDLTLKLYNGTTLVFTASGTFANLTTNPGNGNTDYLFMLDAAQAAAFNSALAGNFNDRIALDSTISFPRQSAGPDSFALVNATGLGALQPVPEPAPFSVMGAGLLGLALLRRKYRTPA
jgi:hypothetical protein